MSARAHPNAPTVDDLIGEASERGAVPWYQRYGLTAPLVVLAVSFATLTALDLWLRRKHAPGAPAFGMGGLADSDPTGFLDALSAWSAYPESRWTATAHAIVDTALFVPAYVFAFLIALRRGRSRLADTLRNPVRGSLLIWRMAGRPSPESFLRSEGERAGEREQSRRDLSRDWRLRSLLSVGRVAPIPVLVLAALDVAENVSSLVLVNVFWHSAGTVGGLFRALARIVWIASWSKWVLAVALVVVVALLWVWVLQAETTVKPKRKDPSRGERLRWWEVPIRWLIGASTRQARTQPEQMTKMEGGLPGSGMREGLLPKPGEMKVGISCSGGGIRSASYNLGALQALRTRDDVWTDEAIVSAVSGGGYIAASHFIVAAKSPSPLPQPPTEHLRVYAPGAPEERFLRNHSSYLSPNLKAKLDLVLNILHGLGMNLLLLTAWVIVVGRPLGWLLAEIQPGLRRPTSSTAGSVDIRAWMWLTPLMLILGTVSTVFLERFVTRFGPAPRSLAAFLRAWGRRLLLLAFVVAVALIAIPYAVVFVRWLASPRFPWDDLVRRLPGLSDASTEKPLPLLIALAGVVASAYRALTATKYSWLVQIGAYVFGPLLVFGMLVLWVDTAAAEGVHRGELQLWAIGGVGIAFLLGWLADTNLWSMHPFYKERLSSAFALWRTSPDEASEYPWELPIRFSTIAPPSWPMLVMCAALNVNEEGIAPPGRAASPFTFTHADAGGPLTDYISMPELEERVPHNAMTLPAIMATSGAALAPNMGKMTRPSLRFLMSLANVRLGIWIPNPLRVDRVQARDPARNTFVWIWRSVYDLGRGPGPLYLLYETFGITHLGRRYIYVTDGGHFDNLGLVELLRRGCTRIYCFDAAGDALDTFNTLGEAIALARSELQVEIALDLTSLRPHRREPAVDPCKPPKRRKGGPDPCQDPNVFSDDDSTIGTIAYPNGAKGDLVFAKAAIVQTAPHDVLAFRAKDPLFPCHPTTDQLFKDEKFEAYRKLGAFTAHRAARKLDILVAQRGSELPPPSPPPGPGPPT